jgi:2-aminoethylphosphonate-pyruvate transaminase
LQEGNLVLKKQLLFTPGPVNVAHNVRQAIATNDICHREVDFNNLLASIEDKLLSLFQIRQKENYNAVVITGSGTAANESVLSSVVGGKHILILSNGEFGERLHKTSVIHNSKTHLLEFPWGQSLNLDVVESYLKTHKIDVIAAVHHETSSGMLNPLAKIGALAKQSGAIFFVDGVSSIGADAIDMEADNIAFCSSSSSKAIGSYAGLSFVVGRKSEFEKLKSYRAKTSYLNLAKFYDFLKYKSQTPNTPGVPLFFALEKALSNILAEGVVSRFEKIRRKADLLRQGMKQMGLDFLLNEQDMSSVLTTVHLPSALNVATLRHRLRQDSIIIYEGKGCFAGKVFQVGNIGELSSFDITQFLNSLKAILEASRTSNDLRIELPLTLSSPRLEAHPDRNVLEAAAS